MQNLSVKEFKEYCNKLNPHCIIFDTENQKWCELDDTIKIKLVFHNININLKAYKGH